MHWSEPLRSSEMPAPPSSWRHKARGWSNYLCLSILRRSGYSVRGLEYGDPAFSDELIARPSPFERRQPRAARGWTSDEELIA